MKLIVGLGNPGSEYENHRHNVGQWVVNLLAHEKRWKWEESRQFFEAWGDWNGEEVFLVKPRTYMNNSGVAVKSLLDEKKGSPADLILIHDDLDLPLEKLRWGFQSGHGGHNGVRSVIEKLETKDFHRLRLGIGRPHGRQEPADYVLEPFTGEDLAAAERMTIEAVKAVHEFLNKLLLKGEADEKI